jgi:hypothetical protein
MLSLFVSVLILGLILKIIKLQSELAELRVNQNMSTPQLPEAPTPTSSSPVFEHQVQSLSESHQSSSLSRT